MNGRKKRITAAAIAGLASITVATAVAATNDKTFSSGTINVGVPNEGVAVKSLKVKTKGTIKDVNVLVGLDTTFNQDFALYLMHPSGKTIHLSSNNGGSGDGYGSGGCAGAVAFDDEAELEIDSFEGVNKTFFDDDDYQPEEVDTNGLGGLEDLDGKNLSGKWRLIASDTEEFGAGLLECFKLDVEYKTPQN
ncbi:MAG: proprotein convertase P-domain-containing protein [Solirubrobacterales bacterium]